MPIPPLRDAVTAKARAVKSRDASLVASADRDLAAARIGAAIDGALANTSLKREHAENLAARIRGAAR